MGQAATLALCSSGPLAYRRGGSGRPLLLVHGWGGSSRYWLGAAALAGRDLIAPDLPGHGESPPPRGPLSMGGLADEVLALADRLGLGSFDLAGHSLGAGVALLIAARRPERVGRLALASFGLPRGPAEAWAAAWAHGCAQLAAAAWAPWLSLWRPWLDLARPWRQALWAAPAMAGPLAAPLLRAPVPPLALALGGADLAGADARALVEAAATAGDPQVLWAAGQLRAPALVLSGAGDPVFPPASASALADALADARLELLPGCGHLPMAEAPGPFYAALGRFFAGQ